MILFKYVSDNIERIRKETRMGLMPSSILRHWQIYGRFDYYKKAGNNTINAVFYASEDMKVSESCVYKIMKTMETEI
jgi:hypothetical protein